MTPTATQVQKPVVIEAKVYELPEPGLHTATIQAVDDLGMVRSEVYNKEIRKVKITYLITDEKAKDGSDLLVFENMSASFGQKARLGLRLRSLGIDTSVSKLDIGELVGMKINANIIHNKVGDKTYANIDSTSRTRRSVAAQQVEEV